MRSKLLVLSLITLLGLPLSVSGNSNIATSKEVDIKYNGEDFCKLIPRTKNQCGWNYNTC